MPRFVVELPIIRSVKSGFSLYALKDHFVIRFKIKSSENKGREQRYQANQNQLGKVISGG
jgi:hypothetical protein